jgi:hypothetical protein
MPPGRLYKLTNFDSLTSFKDPGCVLPKQSAAQGNIRSSLKELDVSRCGSEDLKQQYIKLTEAIL